MFMSSSHQNGMTDCYAVSHMIWYLIVFVLTGTDLVANYLIKQQFH